MAVRRLALGGADFFLHAMGAYWLRQGGTSNVALVVECDGRIDAERLARSLRRFLDVCPWPAARLRRQVPWGMPHWVAAGHSAPPPCIGVVQDGTAIAPHVDAELNAPLDPERDAPLRLRVVHHGGGATSTLIVTWYHSLMDPRGAEQLVAWLGSVDAATANGAWRSDSESLVAPQDLRPLRTRSTIARKGLASLREIERHPPCSLVRDAPPAGPVRWRHVACAAEPEAEGLTDALTYRLAVVGRAVAELFARRGLQAIEYVVPIAVDRRRKGAAGPVIGNYIGIHFARFPSDPVRDPAAVARELRVQMADALRHDLIQASWVGMDLMRHLPVSVALRDLRRVLRDVCSFNCADTGSFALGQYEFLGATVRNAYHVPSVYPRPGLGVFLNRCGDHRNVVVVWVEGTVEPTEVTRLIEIVQQGLGWTAVA